MLAVTTELNLLGAGGGHTAPDSAGWEISSCDTSGTGWGDGENSAASFSTSRGEGGGEDVSSHVTMSSWCMASMATRKRRVACLRFWPAEIAALCEADSVRPRFDSPILRIVLCKGTILGGDLKQTKDLPNEIYNRSQQCTTVVVDVAGDTPKCAFFLWQRHAFLRWLPWSVESGGVGKFEAAPFCIPCYPQQQLCMADTSQLCCLHPAVSGRPAIRMPMKTVEIGYPETKLATPTWLVHGDHVVRFEGHHKLSCACQNAVCAG